MHTFLEGGHKMSRKLFVIGCVLFAVSAMLFASGQNEGAAGSEGPVTITALYSENSTYPFSENWLVVTELEKRGDFNLEIQAVPQSDYETKKQLIFASGDVPDIVMKTELSEIDSFAADGVILPVSDYYEYLPNFKASIDEWDFDSEIRDLSYTDGKLYYLPSMQERPLSDIGWMVRADKLEKYGLEAPETLDELYSVLKAVQKQEPESKGFSNKFKDLLMFYGFGPLFDTRAGWGGGPFIYEEESDSWIFAPAEDNYREMLGFLNKMMENGVMDPENFTADKEQINQRHAKGLAAVTFDWIAAIDSKNKDARNFNPDAEWKAIPPFSGGPGGAKVQGRARYSYGNSIAADLVDDPQFEKKMKIIDWMFYSEEGRLLTIYGVEGKTYENKNGTLEFIPPYKNENGVLDVITLRKNTGCSSEGFDLKKDWNYLSAVFDEETNAYYDILNANNMYAPVTPRVKFTAEELEDKNLLETPLNDYVNEMNLKFIYGEASLDTDWDAFLAECRKKNQEKLKTLYNTAWKR
jgi:putative aldouronate transport system substrate-binding protein